MTFPQHLVRLVLGLHLFVGLVEQSFGHFRLGRRGNAGLRGAAEVVEAGVAVRVERGRVSRSVGVLVREVLEREVFERDSADDEVLDEELLWMRAGANCLTK